MKKFLLAMVAAAAVAMPQVAAAEEDSYNVLFSYNNTEWNLKDFPLRTGGSNILDSQFGCLIYLPTDTVNKYAGGKITWVHIVSPNAFTGAKRNLMREAELVFRYEMSGRSFYHQSLSFGEEALVWNDFELNEPVVIEEDTPFYVGFTGTQTEPDCGTCVFSGFPQEGDTDGSWWLTSWGEWINKGKERGNLMIELSISMPTDPNGVRTFAAKTANAVAGNGTLMLSGNFDKAVVYDINGRVVATSTKAETLNLPAALYLVKFDNAATRKVFVK